MPNPVFISILGGSVVIQDGIVMSFAAFSGELAAAVAAGTTASVSSAALDAVGIAAATAIMANPVTASIAAGVAVGTTVGAYFAFESSEETQQQHAATMQARQTELAAATVRNRNLTQQLNSLAPVEAHLRQNVDTAQAQRQTLQTTRQFEHQRLQANQQRRQTLQVQEAVLEDQLDRLGGPQIF